MQELGGIAISIWVNVLIFVFGALVTFLYTSTHNVSWPELGSRAQS